MPRAYYAHVHGTDRVHGYPAASHPQWRRKADAEHTYREYAGRYQYAPDMTLEVTTDGRKLRWHVDVKDSGGEPVDGGFQPRAKGRFFVPEYDFEATFVRNEHGVVDHVFASDGHLSKKID